MAGVMEINYGWRLPVSDGEMVTLVASHGGDPAPGWWDRVRPHSLGWVSARLDDGQLIGFVNVAWDGGVHAFLLDTKVSSAYQRHGIGIELVRRAGIQAKAAGCEWLHVDFEERLVPFYFAGCGFRPTMAGLIHLPSISPLSR